MGREAWDRLGNERFFGLRRGEGRGEKDLEGSIFIGFSTDAFAISKERDVGGISKSG